MSPVSVDEQELRGFVVALMRGSGMAEGDAATVADVLVAGDLRGQHGHGVNRLPIYFEWIEAGYLDPRAALSIDHVGSAAFVLAAHRAAGAVAMCRAIDEGLAIARAGGVCFGLVRESSHTGVVGYYAERAAAAGCAALIGAAGPALMAYHGAAVPSVSSAPLAIAVPRAGAAISFDMASSVVAFGRIMQARAAKAAIPPDWALAADGTATTDADNAVLPLPLGGPKGSGLALMFELLAGVLSGNPLLGEHAALNGLQNLFLLLIDVAAFRGRSEFAADVEAAARSIKSLPTRAGFEEILLPGERGERNRARQRREGIALPPPTWKALEQLARARGIAPPARKA